MRCPMCKSENVSVGVITTHKEKTRLGAAILSPLALINNKTVEGRKTEILCSTCGYRWTPTATDIRQNSRIAKRNRRKEKARKLWDKLPMNNLADEKKPDDTTTIRDSQAKTKLIWCIVLFTIGGVTTVNAFQTFSTNVFGALMFLAIAGAAFYFGNRLRLERKELLYAPIQSNTQIPPEQTLKNTQNESGSIAFVEQPKIRNSLIAEVKTTILNSSLAIKAIREAIELQRGIPLSEDSVLRTISINSFGNDSLENIKKVIEEIRLQYVEKQLSRSEGNSLKLRSQVEFYAIEIDMPVYSVSCETGDIYEEFVSDFGFSEGNKLNSINTVSRTRAGKEYDFYDIGTVIFPTRKLAEEKAAIVMTEKNI